MLGQLQEQTRWASEAKAEDSQEEQEPEAVRSIPKGQQGWGSRLRLPDQDPVGSTRNTGQDGPLPDIGAETGRENECRSAHSEAGGHGVNAFRSPSASVPERSATPDTTAGRSKPEALCSVGRGQMFTSSALLTLSRVQLTGGEQYSRREDVVRTYRVNSLAELTDRQAGQPCSCTAESLHARVLRNRPLPWSG